MTNDAAVLIAVLGRYGSSAAEPFEPRLEAVGIDIDAARNELTEVLRAAWQSTAPWEAKSTLEAKGTEWVKAVLARRGIRGVEVSVQVMDNLPDSHRS